MSAQRITSKVRSWIILFGFRRSTKRKSFAGSERIVERTDPRGEPYFWIGALREETEQPADTDLAAIAAGYVAVTPVHLDMTHRPSLAALRELVE